MPGAALAAEVKQARRSSAQDVRWEALEKAAFYSGNLGLRADVYAMSG
jgi:hypothetical protein